MPVARNPLIRPFELHRPSDLREALSLAHGPSDAVVYRGGAELLQVAKLGFARFAHLIDLKRGAPAAGELADAR